MDSQASKPVTKQNSEYIKRVNRVLDYLNQHYSRVLTLDALAEIANFSPYHFHRIFKGIVGEPLYKYIQRIRIEKAAHAVRFHTDKPITDIALECGFANSASFSRTFKEYFKMSATAWRNGGYQTFSKNCKVNDKDCKQISSEWQVENISPLYIDFSSNNAKWEISMINQANINVEVKTLAATTIAYIRHIGPFKGETEIWAGLFQKLSQWAGARGLLKCPGTEYFTVFRDDLNITEFAKFKSDVSISVAADTKADGEVGISVIPAGKYAVAQLEINVDEYEQAWELVYSHWLPNSGFQPTNNFCFERYLNDPKMHPTNKHIIEVCVPVEAI